MMRAQGPMMAGPGSYQQAAPQQMGMGPRGAYTMARHQRPPNVSIGPEGLNIGGRVGAGPGPGVGSQEWRHMVMSQQQSMAFSQQMGGGVAHPQQQQQTPQQMRPANFNSQPGMLKSSIIVICEHKIIKLIRKKMIAIDFCHVSFACCLR
jgi:hypothetical protein